MSEAIVITPARRDDLADIQRLAHDIWHAHYPGIITREQIDKKNPRVMTDLFRTVSGVKLLRESGTPSASSTAANSARAISSEEVPSERNLCFGKREERLAGQSTSDCG